MLLYYSPYIRACLDQLLITIRSLTLLCDHSRSKTRLIANMNLLAKPCQPMQNRVSVRCHCRCTALTTFIQTRHGEGEMGIMESAAATAGTLGLCKVLYWLLLIASRNTPFSLHWASDRRRPSIHTDVTLPAQWPT